MENQTLPATAFKSPAIALSGVVDYEMYTKFRTQFDSASDQSIVVIELSTLGGERRSLVEDMRAAADWCEKELSAVEAQVPAIDLPGDIVD
jgi:hypothetical protein